MNSARPKVSIVLPTYNHLRFLPRAVACALDQTSMDFELIIVNDGSTDDTRAWLDNLQHPNVRIFHQQNRGFVAAVNFGIQQSLGEYLSWMSADNRCARYFVEAFVAALGIGNAQHLAAYAKSDFACRLSKCGFKADALALLGSVLEAAASDEMLRPLINTVGLCLLSDVEPVSFVSEALAKNAKLSAEATDACIDVVNTIAELMKAGGSVELLSIEASSRLLALEKPKVFSFLAWKENSSHLPVRGI